MAYETSASDGTGAQFVADGDAHVHMHAAFMQHQLQPRSSPPNRRSRSSKAYTDGAHDAPIDELEHGTLPAQHIPGHDGGGSSCGSLSSGAAILLSVHAQGQSHGGGSELTSGRGTAASSSSSSSSASSSRSHTTAEQVDNAPIATIGANSAADAVASSLWIAANRDDLNSHVVTARGVAGMDQPSVQHATRLLLSQLGWMRSWRGCGHCRPRCIA